MSGDHRPPEPPDEGVIFLEDGGRDDVARALEEAERAVAAVEERHRQKAEEEASVALASPEAPGELPEEEGSLRMAELERLRLEERERALKAEEDLGRVREALVRKAADFENLKRRHEREKTDFFKFALAETFRELLAVVDNFERAVIHRLETTERDEFVVGIEMISQQLADVMKRNGLQEVAAAGQPFDPNVHEAMVSEATDAVPPGTVLEVLQRGYILNDRLLRPARVKVAAAPGRTNGSGEAAS